MLKLPKNYLSYSAVSCFNKTSTHRDWIKRYLYKEPFFETKELLFGRRTSDNLEKENLFDVDLDLVDVLGKVQVEGKAETNIVLQQHGFYVTAYLDKCAFDYSHITEYKTGKGINSKGEAVGWTQEKVAKHLQLDTYSWLIYENFGIQPTSELIWMETENDGSSVRFTGRVERFQRTVTLDEIKDVKDLFKSTAEEMEKVYQLFLDGHDLLTDAKYARELIKGLAA